MNLLFFQSRAHEDSECSEVMGWILSHKGKATTSETTYNPDDPPEAYSNPSIHSRINAYMETGRQIHGTEWDPIRASFDGEAVMRMGHEKKHGHYYMGDSILDTAVVWASLGPLPRWVPGPTTRWAPRTTRLVLHDT
jgi:hypothetical protein